MRLSSLDLSRDRVLYEQVADLLQEQIVSGIFKQGDRLPSIRKLKQQLAVSFSTVTEAYRLLEDRGLVAARPQSGYYVKATALQLHLEPALTEPYARVREITSLTFNLLSDILEPDIISLGIASPSTEHLPVAQLNRLMAKVMREHPEVHTYNLPLGSEMLRAELSKRMLDAGCSIHPDHLLITNGAHEAIYLALQALTIPGDTVAIASPAHFALIETLKALNLKVYTLPTQPHEFICLPELETALASGKVQVCLLGANFSYPLGTCMADHIKKQLVELITRYKVPLIEEDVYGEMYFEGTRPSALKAFDTQNQVIYCSSISKTLSPGLRVGWCSGGCHHLTMIHRKLVTNRMSAIAPQLVVAAFLANGGYDRHLRHLRRVYQTQMNRMLQAIYDYFPAETCVTHPSGGHVLWITMPEGFDAIQLYESALQKGISIAPGPIFSASNERYRNCFALNTTLPWSDTVNRAMQTLGYLIKKQMAVSFLESSP